MYVNTHSLQQAPLRDQGGRMKSHVKGSVLGVRVSIRQNISAAFKPFLLTFLPSESPGTKKLENKALVIRLAVAKN